MSGCWTPKPFDCTEEEHPGQKPASDGTGGKLDGSAWFAALHADETGIGMVAHRFPQGGFLFRLLVRHTSVDALENLLLRETGILQAAERGAAECRETLQTAMEHGLNGVVGEPDQAKHYSIAADGIELVGAREFQNLRLGVTGAHQAGHRLGAVERMLLCVRGGKQRDAGVIPQATLFELHHLRDFRVRGVKGLKLLDAAGKHSRLIERAVIRERMLLAAAGKDQRKTEEQDARSHTFIVSAAMKLTRGCAVGDTRRKDR